MSQRIVKTSWVCSIVVPHISDIRIETVIRMPPPLERVCIRVVPPPPWFGR